MVFPNDLVFIPPMDIQSSHFRIASGLLVIFISIYIVAKKRRYPKELSFAIIWFFLWLLPMNNFLNTFRILLAYRFVYIAMLGFSLLLGFFLERIWQVSTRFLSEALILRRTLVLFFLILLCMASFYTNFFWKNERLLYLAVTEKYPSLVSTRIALGRALFKYGNYKEALKQLNDILAHHQHRMGRYDLANTYYSLGLIYMTISEYPKSEQNYLEAIKLFPQKPQLYTELGICYAQQGLYKKALEQFSKAKALDPGYILAYLQSGVTYKLMREYPKAEREFKRALEMYPDSREALYYLENLRGTGGKE
jgi:tetratricopeptide (TPR) repeat protein